MKSLNGFCKQKGAYVQYADINGDGKDDMICDDLSGNHWIQLSKGNGGWKDLGRVLKGFCGGGAVTKWADLNGDGKADILCDDNKGNHWA
jgi:hypothetical protein